MLSTYHRNMLHVIIGLPNGKREEIRHKSLISKNVQGVICGFGLKSYDLAIQSFTKDE